MTRFRVAIAVVALIVISGVFVSIDPLTAAVYNRPFVWALWIIVVPMVITVVGLVRRAYQARWVGIALALAAMPLATALTFEVTTIRSDIRFPLTLVSAVVLLMALVGRPMFEAFEGRSQTLDWSGPRMGIVRWTVIANVASAFSLLLFVAGSQMVSFQAALLPSAFLAVVVAGVLLLARQNTGGLLLLAGGCIGLLSAGSYLVIRDDVPLTGVLVIGAVFGPGIVLGCVLLALYAKPLVQHLRGSG